MSESDVKIDICESLVLSLVTDFNYYKWNVYYLLSRKITFFWL